MSPSVGHCFAECVQALLTHESVVQALLSLQSAWVVQPMQPLAASQV
jgi:hypothetical protein